MPSAPMQRSVDNDYLVRVINANDVAGAFHGEMVGIYRRSG